MFVTSPVAKVFPSVRLSLLRLSASIELLSNVSLKLNNLLCLELFYFYSSVCGKPYGDKSLQFAWIVSTPTVIVPLFAFLHNK